MTDLKGEQMNGETSATEERAGETNGQVVILADDWDPSNVKYPRAGRDQKPDLSPAAIPRSPTHHCAGFRVS